MSEMTRMFSISIDSLVCYCISVADCPPPPSLRAAIAIPDRVFSDMLDLNLPAHSKGH